MPTYVMPSCCAAVAIGPTGNPTIPNMNWTPCRLRFLATKVAPSTSLMKFPPVRVMRTSSGSARTERLLEQREHRGPGAAVSGRVVGERRVAELVGVRVREAVHRAAVARELPVDGGLSHLRLERGDLRGRNQRV